MSEDGLTEFAMLFKDRDNKKPGSMTTGIVIMPPPQAQIHLNDGTTLYNRHLIWSAHMLVDYKRGLELEGDIKFNEMDAGITTTASAHSHGIQTLNVDTKYEAKNVQITMKDTVESGDEVIIMPVVDNQLYYVLDKAVRFE